MTDDLSVRKTLLVATAVVLALVGAFGYGVIRKELAARRAGGTRWTLRETGPAFIEAVACDPRHPALTDAKALSDFVLARSETARDTPRTLESLVPLPLIPSDRSVAVVCWPQDTEQLQKVMVPYDTTADQVVLFVLDKDELYGHVHVYLSVKYRQNFVTESIRRSQAKLTLPHRSGMDFFNIAERMWTAAQAHDRAAFDSAAASFKESDTFYFEQDSGDPYVFSGKQLQQMKDRLSPLVAPAKPATPR